MLKNIYRFLSPKFQTLFSEYKVDLKPRYGHGLKPHQELHEIINANRNLYRDTLTKSLAFKDSIQQIKKQSEESDTNLPTWNNGFLPGLDIIGIYTIITIYKPNKYIEVGSGNSTKVAFKAKTENNLGVK